MAFAIGIITSVAPAAITFTQTGYVVLPNGQDGSSSYDEAVDTLMDHLISGTAITGDYTSSPEVPGLVSGQVTPESVIVGDGSFDFWYADTGHPQKSGESGSRLGPYFVIMGDGTEQFTITNDGLNSNLSFEFDSDDTSQVFQASVAGPIDYTPSFRGIDWGNDRSPGGGDDTVWKNDIGVIPLDMIVGVVGQGILPVGGGSNQDQIDASLAYLLNNDPITHSFVVSYNNGSVDIDESGNILISSVPEPASVALMGIGGFLILRRKKGSE